MPHQPYQPRRFGNAPRARSATAREIREAAELFADHTALTITHHAFLAATFARMATRSRLPARGRGPTRAEVSVAVSLATQHYKREFDRRRHEAGLLSAACRPDRQAPRGMSWADDRPRRYRNGTSTLTSPCLEQGLKLGSGHLRARIHQFGANVAREVSND